MSKHYSAPHFHEGLSRLYSEVIKNPEPNIFKRKLPKEIAGEIRTVLKSIFPGKADDFGAGFHNFIKERAMLRDLYKILANPQRFYGYLDNYFGGDFFPKKDGKYDLIACENLWRQYSKRAFDFLVDIANNTDPDDQHLTPAAEFDAASAETLINSLVNATDPRKSYEAVLMLKLMLLEANNDKQVRQLESGASYSIYYSKQIGELVKYLGGQAGEGGTKEGKQEKLFMDTSKDYDFILYLNPDNDFRVYRWDYGPAGTKEEDMDYGVLHHNLGDYKLLYDLRSRYSKVKSFLFRFKDNITDIPTLMFEKAAGKRKYAKRQYNIKKVAEQIKRDMLPIKMSRTMRLIRIIDVEKEEGKKVKDIAVQLLHRIKPRNTLELKQWRKDYIDLGGLSDIIGIKLIFITETDAKKCLNRILNVLPPASGEKAEFSNNLFALEDLKQILNDEVFNQICLHSEERTQASDENWRSFKYNALFDDKIIEVQITLVPYLANEEIGMGQENHMLLRLRQYLDTLIPALLYEARDVSYKEPWNHICMAIFNHYITSKKGRKKRRQYDYRLDFIEFEFADYLVKFIKKYYNALMTDIKNLPAERKSNFTRLPDFLDSKALKEDFSRFRAAMTYLEKKTKDIKSKIEKTTCGFEIYDSQLLEGSRRNSLVKLLADSFLSNCRNIERKNLFQEIKELKNLSSVVLLREQLNSLIDRAFSLMPTDGIIKWGAILDKGLSYDLDSLQGLLTDLEKDIKKDKFIVENRD